MTIDRDKVSWETVFTTLMIAVVILALVRVIFLTGKYAGLDECQEIVTK